MSRYLLICASLLAVLAVPVAAQDAVPTTTAEDVIALKAQLQAAREEVRAMKIVAAQCDAAWADTRARLASLELSNEGQALHAGRAQVDEAATAAGFTVDWGDPAQPNTPRRPVSVTKSSADSQ